MVNLVKKLALKAAGPAMVLIVALAQAGAGAAEPVSLARQAELTSLVRQDCGSCHGMTLKGGLGKSLLPANLSDLALSELENIILDGIPGTPMPGWRGLLTTSEANWIAEHLKAGSIKRGNVQ